jgi:hypothetical protein
MCEINIEIFSTEKYVKFDNDSVVGKANVCAGTGGTDKRLLQWLCDGPHRFVVQGFIKSKEQSKPGPMSKQLMSLYQDANVEVKEFVSFDFFKSSRDKIQVL